MSLAILEAPHTPPEQMPTQNGPTVPSSPSESDHRGNGKVARLPKVLRDQINSMLDDGVSYKAIIQKLEQSLPYPLSEMNISRWKDFGYQAYLRQQQWRDEMQHAHEDLADLDQTAAGPKVQETVIQVGITEIFLALRKGDLRNSPADFTRVLNSLSRLSREALVTRKYADQQAKEKAEARREAAAAMVTDLDSANDAAPASVPGKVDEAFLAAFEATTGIKPSPTRPSRESFGSTTQDR